MMTWWVYVWIGFIVLGILAGIAMVGKRKEPYYTPQGAVIGLVIGAAQIAGILYLANH